MRRRDMVWRTWRCGDYFGNIIVYFARYKMQLTLRVSDIPSSRLFPKHGKEQMQAQAVEQV